VLLLSPASCLLPPWEAVYLYFQYSLTASVKSHSKSVACSSDQKNGSLVWHKLTVNRSRIYFLLSLPLMGRAQLQTPSTRRWLVRRIQFSEVEQLFTLQWWGWAGGPRCLQRLYQQQCLLPSADLALLQNESLATEYPSLDRRKEACEKWTGQSGANETHGSSTEPTLCWGGAGWDWRWGLQGIIGHVTDCKHEDIWVSEAPCWFHHTWVSRAGLWLHEVGDSVLFCLFHPTFLNSQLPS
jgi:hypothetical protein